jgi:hypothetical protein
MEKMRNSMKKYLATILPAAMMAVGLVNTANAELVTEVIHTNVSTSAYLETVDGYGSTAAWSADVDGSYNYKIHYWNGTSVELISSDGVRAALPSLYDGKVAYVGQNVYGTYNDSLRYWDGTYNNGAPNVVEIATGNRIRYLSLYNGRIAWSAYDGNDWEVYYWDGTYNNGQPNIAQVTNNNEIARGVELDGTRVVWSEGGDGNTPSTLYYWEGAAIQTLNVDASIAPTAANMPSADNSGIAWRGIDGNIYYWDGTFTGSDPNVVMAVSKVNESGTGTLGNPSLHDGRISYTRRESWRMPWDQQHAIFYWDGSNTAQLSEWYSIDGFFIPSTTSNSVFYTGRNAITSQHEIRQVTSTGLCL